MTLLKRVKFFIPVLVILGSAFICTAVFAADKIKSLSFIAFYTGDQISSPTSTDFTVYVGDNLSGVVDPIKSVFLEVSGVYTGGGTLGLTINSDASSLVSYDLPTVTHPTKFSVLYKDPAGLISPVSAGEYTYSLGVSPSGIVISGLNAVSRITYRYTPTACDDGQPTAEKVKTTKFLVLSSAAQISSPTTTPFEIYLGDDVSGVTNPVKSLFFEISGVYTGGGSLEVSVDSDPNTSKTYVLPTVGSATPFSFTYEDDTGLVKPTSAGAFQHTFDLNPSGVTLSGFSVVAIMTNRYKPPSCGTGFPVYGDLTSPIYDVPSLGISPAYNSILWKGALGGPTQNHGKVKFRFAASNDPAGPWNDADFVGGADCTAANWFETSGSDQPAEIKCFGNLNNKRYFRYKARICSEDCQVAGDYTPTIDDIVINWSP